MATIAVQTDGVIEAGKCYPIATFRTLTGMGPAAIREARKKGFWSVAWVSGRSSWGKISWTTYAITVSRSSRGRRPRAYQ